MVDVAKLFMRPTFLLKLLELIFAAVCTALVAGEVSVGDDLNKVALIYVTIMGFIMINSLLILGYILDTPLHKFLVMIVDVSGCIMFVTAGALMCEYYGQTTQLGNAAGRLLASGIIAIVNSVVYGADAFFTFRETEG